MMDYSAVECRKDSTVQCTVEPGLGKSAEPKEKFLKCVQSRQSRNLPGVQFATKSTTEEREHQISLDWSGGKGRVEAPEGIKFVAGGDLSEGTGGHLDNR